MIGENKHEKEKYKIPVHGGNIHSIGICRHRLSAHPYK